MANEKNKPDYILNALDKRDSRYCEVGAAWVHQERDGKATQIRIELNPTVVLTPDKNIVLTLFSSKYKGKEESE